MQQEVGRRNKWVRAHGYTDREAYVFTYYTGGTRMNMCMSQVVWFRKNGVGVIMITFFWRAPFVIDEGVMQREMSLYMRGRHGVSRNITVVQTRKNKGSEGVLVEMQSAFRLGERPSSDEMQQWLEELDQFDLTAFETTDTDAA